MWILALGLTNRARSRRPGGGASNFRQPICFPLASGLGSARAGLLDLMSVLEKRGERPKIRQVMSFPVTAKTGQWNVAK